MLRDTLCVATSSDFDDQYALFHVYCRTSMIVLWIFDLNVECHYLFTILYANGACNSSTCFADMSCLESLFPNQIIVLLYSIIRMYLNPCLHWCIMPTFNFHRNFTHKILAFVPFLVLQIPWNICLFDEYLWLQIQIQACFLFEVPISGTPKKK